MAIPFTEDGLIEGSSSWIVAAAPDAVWRRIVQEAVHLPDADRALALGGHAVVKPPAADQAGVHVAEDIRALAIQGGWWYRGVTSVAADPRGSRVTYSVINVAPGWTKWIAHIFMARSHRRHLGGAAPRPASSE